MGEVQSTTNLTAGLSGGGQESTSEFYDEVFTRFILFTTFARFHGLPTPAGFPS